MPTSYLHTMIRITDPDATVAFFKLIGLEEVRRFDSEAGRFTLIFLAFVFGFVTFNLFLCNYSFKAAINCTNNF